MSLRVLYPEISIACLIANMSSQACQPWLLSMTRLPPFSRASTSSMPMRRLNSRWCSSFLCLSWRGKFSRKYPPSAAPSRSLGAIASMLAEEENIFTRLSSPMVFACV